jgi:5-(carboxyamino)imidazole ribonucleotide mutase
MSDIAVILGSDSDKNIFDKVSRILIEFDVSFEQRIISAHRTPDVLRDYVLAADERGVKVFIAVAGMAAALPGAVASFTTKPVIGVPAASGSPVMGFDSIFSILQMPPGVPVAAVAVNGGVNAALLSIEILALSNKTLAKRLVAFRDRQKTTVQKKDEQFRKDTLV